MTEEGWNFTHPRKKAAARASVRKPPAKKKGINKADLVDVLMRNLGTDRRQATAVVESVLDTIVRTVHSGDSVTIAGFGVFEQRRRAPRVARNPRTGETVRVKPTSVPAFRPGARFKAVIAGEERLAAEGPAVKRSLSAQTARKAAEKGVAKKAVAKKAVKKAPAKKTVQVPVAKKLVKKASVKKIAKQSRAGKVAAKKGSR